MTQHETHRMQSTSLLAWDEFQGKLGERQMIIFNAIAELCKVQGDATDTETMTHLLQQDPNYVRPRRNELVNDFKLIGYAETRRCKLTGNTCRAWKLTKRGNEVWKMSNMQKEKIFD